MGNAIEVMGLALAVALGGVAFAVRARRAHPLTMLRGVAVFEAFKGVAALIAAGGLLAIVRHAALLDAASVIVGHLGLGARGAQAFEAFDHALVAERLPLLLGAFGYAALHLTEGWGLWHARPWGEALGVASGAVYLPFEFSHLLHRPSLPAATILVLNLLLVAFLVGRLRRRAGRGTPS